MKTGSIYELDGKVSLKQAVPLGMQHVLSMFVGNVSPLIIVCGLLQMPAEQKTMLIQNAMFIAGIVTLIQLYPIWKVGAGLPIVMGTSSGFVPTVQVTAGTFGYSSVMGASLIGALLEIILGFFILNFLKIF